jgi:hypothetical protein
MSGFVAEEEGGGVSGQGQCGRVDKKKRAAWNLRFLPT